LTQSEDWTPTQQFFTLQFSANSPVIEINWNPDARSLRWFAGLQIAFFCVVAWLWRSSLGASGGAILIAVSTVSGLIGLARPTCVKPVYIAWMVAVFPIGWVMSHVVLAVVYYVVLTPIALMVRRRRGDPLQRQFEPAASTYWTLRRPADSTERYFRQY
jgi:hypothetical protein